MRCHNHSEARSFNSLIDLSVTEAVDVIEPVTLAEIKEHLRVTFTDDDTYLTMLIKAARASIEKYTGLSLVEKEVTLYCNNSEGGYDLPYGPVIGDPVATDSNDATVTATFYGIQFKRLVSPASSEVRLTYTAGYETVPADLKLAIMHEVAYLYEHRGDEAYAEDISPIAKGMAKRYRRVPYIL